MNFSKQTILIACLPPVFVITICAILTEAVKIMSADIAGLSVLVSFVWILGVLILAKQEMPEKTIRANDHQEIGEIFHKIHHHREVKKFRLHAGTILICVLALVGISILLSYIR